ncbi:MAG: hypothetical protein ACD_75C02088G0001, partial [uncultured bacterium]
MSRTHFYLLSVLRTASFQPLYFLTRISSA